MNFRNNKKTMVVKYFLIIILFCSFFIAKADDYDEAWAAINDNNRTKARELLLKAIKNPARAVDAYMTLIILNSFDGKELESVPYFEKILEIAPEPYHYAYTIWFHEAVAGGYGVKTKAQVKFLEKSLNDIKANGSVKAASLYGMAIHYYSTNELDDAIKSWKMVGAVDKWQFVGPFDNVSSSGFDKDYPPIKQPEGTAKFTSSNNATVEWFTPTTLGNDCWTFPSGYIKERNMVTYAQSFANFPADTEGVLCLGFGGNVKVWLNDKLVLTESEELNTELDMMKAVCSFKKGYNRILIQNGTTKNSANFIVRLTDKNFNPLPNLSYKTDNQPYTKEADASYDASKVIALGAETYFMDKMKAEPANLLNYYLLCKIYLRNQKIFQAQNTIADVLEKAPKNSILLYEQLQCFSKAKNRTDLVTIMEQLKEQDSTSLFALALQIDQFVKEEKYDEASRLLDKRIELYGNNAETLQEQINIAAKQNKIEPALEMIRRGYTNYPSNRVYVAMWYNIQKNVYKENRTALRVYEKYNEDYFSVEIMNELAGEYLEQGMNDKSMKLYEKIVQAHPNDSDYLNRLAQYHYGKKNTEKALEYTNRQLKLAPYHSAYWESLGLIYEQQNNKTEAIKAFKQGLYYNPNAYDIRRKLEWLENQLDITKLLPNTNGYELIRNTKTEDKEQKYDWYYILDEKTKIVYQEGTSEEYYNMAVKILTDKGIETWKESSIPYGYSQRLVVEKAEVVKKNGSKTAAERNDNEIVFANLEKGDAVYLKYKLESYKGGKLAKEFWDKYTFNAFVPVEQVRYTLIVSDKLSFDYKVHNADMKPTIDQKGDFKIYTWASKNEPAMKEETRTPASVDICKVLHFSSIKNWQAIANWYSDLSSPQAKADFEVKKLFKTLFPDGKTFNNEQKARIIYDYVVKNITYSSVSFRQSSHVPQKAAKTINTKLGDCKDLSTLYATLAREAGLEANLVLINTKDNGDKDMLLPSTDFNHCIVKVKVDSKSYFLELTDAYLPFAALPNIDNEAQILEIPYNKMATDEALKPLTTKTRVTDEVKRKTNISINQNDLLINVNGVKKGYASAYPRYKYASLNKEKQMEELRKSISSSYKNPVVMTDANYANLDKLEDSVKYDYTYTVKNEVIEIGEMKTFKVPYGDVFVRTDHFVEETRQFPISYWQYEDTDAYTEEMTLQLPAGKVFVEIPKDVAAEFKGIKYKLSFKKTSATTLKIVRIVQINKENIQPEDYLKFRDFVNIVTTAEAKYVAFK
jgi:tetratricopeptide (TPR) repeat protein